MHKFADDSVVGLPVHQGRKRFERHLFLYEDIHQGHHRLGCSSQTILMHSFGSAAAVPHHCSDSALRSFLNTSDQLTSSFGCAGGPAIRGGVIGCERFMIDTLVDHCACMPSGAQAFVVRFSFALTHPINPSAKISCLGSMPFKIGCQSIDHALSYRSLHQKI